MKVIIVRLGVAVVVGVYANYKLRDMAYRRRCEDCWAYDHGYLP